MERSRSTHKKNNKGQAWYLDFISATLIFAVGIAAYYYLSINVSSEEKILYGMLSSEADSLSSALLGEGYPKEWTEDDVILIGLTSADSRLNERKWVAFSQMGYNQTKSLLGTEYDYYLFIEEQDGQIAQINGSCGIGSPKVNSSAQVGCKKPDMEKVGYKSLIRRDRYLFFKEKQVMLGIYLWV